jgi:RsiW-degrading membrane proteinase PrsW (M82 family)
MITSNNLFKAVLFFLGAFGTFYLLGAFYSASFNISNWPVEVRLGVAVFGTLIAFILAAAYLVLSDEKKHGVD